MQLLIMQSLTQTKDYLSPSKLELVFYGVLSFVIIFAANFNYLANYLVHNTGGVPEFDKGITSLYTDGFLSFVDGLAFIPTSAIFIFWSLVGIVVYTILQSVLGLLAELKNDIDITQKYLHPSNFLRWKFWAEVFLQLIAHISLYSLMVLWSFLLGYVLIPLSTLFSSRLLGDFDFYNVASFIGSFALLYVGVIVFALILKLFFKRKQLVI